MNKNRIEALKRDLEELRDSFDWSDSIGGSVGNYHKKEGPTAKIDALCLIVLSLLECFAEENATHVHSATCMSDIEGPTVMWLCGKSDKTREIRPCLCEKPPTLIANDCPIHG